MADSIDPRRCRVGGRSPEAAGFRDRRVDEALDLKEKKKNDHLSLGLVFTVIYNVRTKGQTAKELVISTEIDSRFSLRDRV